MDDDEVEVVGVTVSELLMISCRDSGVISAVNSKIQR